MEDWLGEEDEDKAILLNPLGFLPSLDKDEENRRKEKKSIRFGLRWRWINEWVHFILIQGAFTLKPPIIKSIYILSKMKAHLINLRSNGIESIMKVNVLRDTHVGIKNFRIWWNTWKPVFMKKSLFYLFEPKLISFKLTSLSLIPSFTANPPHFGL